MAFCWSCLALAATLVFGIFNFEEEAPNTPWHQQWHWDLMQLAAKSREDNLDAPMQGEDGFHGEWIEKLRAMPAQSVRDRLDLLKTFVDAEETRELVCPTCQRVLHSLWESDERLPSCLV